MRPELDETLQAPDPGTAPTVRGGTPVDHTATMDGPARAPVLAATSSLLAGQQLGHFRIDRLLGAGGMGEVYLATDLALDRPVAIKVLPGELARDPSRRDRLIREARAQARVTHPNVGHMYFVGEEGGRLFFAMEYVAGETLAARCAKGPMHVDDALAVIRAAALGLREAQRSGFTHRDVKPSNLMLDGHGVLKVLDFGLAAGAPGAVGDGPVAQTSLAGTPLYMAPEQARGEAVDLRSDIYALGVTLYQLVAGKPPFVAESAEELISMHSTAVRPGLPRRGVPRAQIGAIDALCARMMAARPEDRFASYDELLHALELASLAHTRPAGFWVRGIAVAIDFLVIVLALGLLLALMSAIARGLGDMQAEIGGDSIIAFVGYIALSTGRWGTTVGKALFELEVVDLDSGSRPRPRQVLVRTLGQYGLPLLTIVASRVLELTGVELPDFVRVAADAGWAAFLAGAMIHAAARVAGKRTPWDRWSSTMVRYRTSRPASAL